jgi:hypothetical protein
MITKTIRIKNPLEIEEYAGIPQQAEASEIYDKFRLKFSMVGSYSKEENISTYTKTTERDLYFEREWTWDREAILPEEGDANFEISAFSKVGVISFFEGYVVSAGKCNISVSSVHPVPDLGKPADVALLGSTTNSSETVGTETITYTGTGAPANPSPTNLTGNLTPPTGAPTYGGAVGAEEWGINKTVSLGGLSWAASAGKVDISGWTDAQWMDKLAIFTKAYNVPIPAGWDACDVVMTWEWELS